MRYVRFMLRTHWMKLWAGVASAALWGCGDNGALDSLPDASAPLIPDQPTPMVDSSVPGEMPEDSGPPPALADAGASDASSPDPLPGFDGGSDFDCVEEFAWDPKGRTDVQSVVLASGLLSSWNPAASPALAREDDGIWRLRVPMDAAIMAYKFVINGSEWRIDDSACHSEDDGFGGQNSLRYACLEAPLCPHVPEPDAGSDAGTSDVSDAALPDTDSGLAGSDGGPGAIDGGLDGSDGGANATDAGTTDPATDAATGSEPDASSELDAGVVISPDCACYRTVWVDLDDHPGVVQDDILEVSLTGAHAAFGSWNPGFSSVVLQPAGQGVWFARVAPPSNASEYKVTVRHKNGAQHATQWLHDQGNCHPRKDDNNVLYGCGSEPSSCAQATPSVELPGNQVDLCTECQVSLSIPRSASAALASARSVALQGEQAPLSWGGSYPTVQSESAFTATITLPRGRYEYQIKLDDGEFTRDPANCHATPNGNNSFLYGCITPPACE